MLHLDQGLLCFAALVLYSVDQVAAVPQWGCFEKRFPSSNDTAPSIVSSSNPVTRSSTSLPIVSGTSIVSTSSDAVTARLSVAAQLPANGASSSSEHLETLHRLESITTVRRPTTFTLGLGTATTASVSSVLPQEVSTSTSDLSFALTTSSVTYQPISITTLPATYESSNGSATTLTVLPNNGTNHGMGWNITSATVNVLPNVNDDTPTTTPTITIYNPSSSTSPVGEGTANSCDVTTNSNTVTVWSTIYTTTITWTLPPEDYTPPYPETTTSPVFCPGTPLNTARLTLSYCDDCVQNPYPTSTAFGDPYLNPTATQFTGIASPSVPMAGVATITFWTTDKNPAVVYSSEPPPDYGDKGTTIVQNHNTPDSDTGTTTTPDYERASATQVNSKGSGSSDETNLGPGTGAPKETGGVGGVGGAGDGAEGSSGNGSGSGGDNNEGGSGGINDDGGDSGSGNIGNLGDAPSQTSPQPAKQSPPATAVTVIIQTTQVIINDKTFTDSPQSQTSTVVVGTDTFTIDPSEVIGAGATVLRPVKGNAFVPPATTTTVSGVQVVYTAIAGSTAANGSPIAIATLDGTTFTLDATPTTVIVKGQTITLGPRGVAFASQTIPIVTAVGATQSAVLGGEMITAIGKSLLVIEGTTITYGPDMSSTITKVVDGDTIVIGPSGVIVHNTTLGGMTAAASATSYEIVGGATITEVGGSAVVVDGTVYSIGPGATSAITTVIDGQTLTIGPDGVIMSTYTFAQPYATSTVIVPGGTSALATATKTAGNSGPSLRSNRGTGIIVTCIAIGVGILNGLLS